MTAVLGLDLGERRIGVAIADEDGLSARPLTTLSRARSIEGDAAALDRLIAAHDVVELIVGLPLDASGVVGTQATITRDWVTAITAALQATPSITFQDERLTSHVAEGRIGPMPRGRAGGPPTRAQRDAYRARVDREAAAIILQDALDTRRADGTSRLATPTTMEIPS